MKHKKSIHVVYIITKLELGGAQKVCLALLDGVPDASFSTSLISGSEGYLSTRTGKNSQVILLDQLVREVSLFQAVSELRVFLHLIRTLHTLKKQYPSLIVHTHSTKAGIVGRWAAWCAGITTRIHTIHGYGFHQHQSWITWLSIYLLECITSLITTHFVCVSSADVKTGISLLPLFGRKHSIIRAAVDTTPFYLPAIPLTRTSLQKNFVYGSIACFKPQKNLLDLLQAFQRVHHHNPHTRLEIIGDGIQRPLLEQWITNHDLTSVITLHGWKDQVAPIMKTWDSFVLSSLWEGLPCALIEARLLQLPVISYNTGGIKDVISHELNGLLCEQKDIASLAHHMLTLSRNNFLYERLRNYKDNLIDFDFDHMIQEHRKLYEKIASRI